MLRKIQLPPGGSLSQVSTDIKTPPKIILGGVRVFSAKNAEAREMVLLLFVPVFLQLFVDGFKAFFVSYKRAREIQNRGSLAQISQDHFFLQRKRKNFE